MGGIGLKLFQIDFQRIIGVLGGNVYGIREKKDFQGELECFRGMWKGGIEYVF